MKELRIRRSGITAIKYFLSYLLVITILILGFFVILKQQITDNYFEYRSQQAQLQLQSIAGRFKDDLVYLSQVDAAIVSDMELIESRYQKSAYTYLALSELREYASTTQLIRSIVYMPKKTNIPLSTHLPVSYNDGVFFITNSIQEPVSFDPTPYYNARAGQLIYLHTQHTQYLIYFPAISERANYVFFYLLDTSGIQQQMIASEEIPAIALLDAQNQPVVDINFSTLSSYMGDTIPASGVYQQDASVFLCIHRDLPGDYSLVCLLSRDFLSERINESFGSSYLALMLLSGLGFLLIALAMRITYLPLHRLTQKLVPDANTMQGYLGQLESAFSEAEGQKQLLTQKLENYRLSIQKTLLDSLVIARYPGDTNALDIDQLFDPGSHSRIYVLSVRTQADPIPWEEIQHDLIQKLPTNSACILMDLKQTEAVFLINFAGDSADKDLRMNDMCQYFFDTHAYLCALSNGSDSPLDIPVLYENAVYAASYWPQIPVSAFPLLPLGFSTFAYPHEDLDKLTEFLSENNFIAVRSVVNALCSQVALCVVKQGNLTTFFIQCILTDILTRLTNYMNLMYIRFTDYSDLYFNTLNLCRNSACTEKTEEIRHNIGCLIDFCEQFIAEKNITSAPLIRIIEENYCQSDFSIAVLADKFHVSTAYMSQLAKKELNMNFSEYLWSMRQKKAQSLLSATELPIEDISLAVGYINTSSFRRKFKQETGMTPSQYRDSCRVAHKQT